MLRNALVEIPTMTTWPCDEINYIWGHGNLRYPTDEFPSRLARSEVRRYIRGQFALLEGRPGTQWVVEKTCANSLRIEFVNEILPEARYVYIRRNAMDAVASAVQRWRAPLEPIYVMRKARFVPPSDIPYLALRYARNRLHKLTTRRRRLGTWGPKFHGMESLLRTCSLPEVCAHQWQRCVQSAEAALAKLPQERVCAVRYEQFVSDPSGGLGAILDFLEVSVDPQVVITAVRHVTAARVGKGADELDKAGLEAARAIVDDS